MKSLISAANFTNNMSWSSWTWYNFWSLLTINFKCKYFHNSVDWSGLHLQVYFLSWLAKILTFKDFRLLENAFEKLPTLGMIWSLISHVEQPLNKFSHLELARKNFIPHLPWKAFRKRSLDILWRETLCPCSTGKSCGSICSLNVC